MDSDKPGPDTAPRTSKIFISKATCEAVSGE
jgi:hypothetical protein